MEPVMAAVNAFDSFASQFVCFSEFVKKPLKVDANARWWRYVRKDSR